MPYTILVTGANKGIGYEAVKLLSQRKPNATILLGSRSVQNGDDAISRMKTSVPSHSFANVSTLQIDITDPLSLHSAAQHVLSTFQTLDVLLHNSGIAELNGDNKHPAVFDVNVRGAKTCIESFAPILTPKTGIITLVSSSVGPLYMQSVGPELRAELDDIPSVTWEKVEGWMKDWETFASGGKAVNEWLPLGPNGKDEKASKYRASKVILNPWIRRYAVDHPELRVAVVCPGHCATDLNGFKGSRPAEQGGESVVWPIFNDFSSAKFYKDGKEIPYDRFIF